MTEPAPPSGKYGVDPYGKSPYGGARSPFGIEAAVALSPTRIRVRYTAMFDPTYPPLVSPATYAISPTVAVESVVLETAQTVILQTLPLDNLVYTVTLRDARGYFGEPLYFALQSGDFAGFVGPTFHAVATRSTRVRVVFSEPMYRNPALVDPAQYVLTDMAGASIGIVSVSAEQISGVRATVLELGVGLVAAGLYQLKLLDTIVSEADYAPLTVKSTILRWVETALSTQIPITAFSGEAMGGLFGLHSGLVFFSPALESPASNSIIQVDQVDVCSRAYDEYHFPSRPVPSRALMTHGAGIVGATVTKLNSKDVLWVAAPHVETRIQLGGSFADSISAPVDGAVTATLVEAWPQDRVALLNNSGWRLFGAGSAEHFITADNLTAFPISPPVVTSL